MSDFPLSRSRQIRGTRRLAREKVMQLLAACMSSNNPWQDFFDHIIYRDFNFGDQEQNPGKLLSPEEIQELESDTRIDWDETELAFIRELTHRSLDEAGFTDALIERFAQNWELERIALMDRVLLQMATAELIHFESIPAKVTINEIIELAKRYSTDKSNVFINGVLDAVVAELNETGRLHKSGRGLLDS